MTAHKHEEAANVVLLTLKSGTALVLLLKKRRMTSLTSLMTQIWKVQLIQSATAVEVLLVKARVLLVPLRLP